MSPSRRALLQTAAAALGGGLAATTGCLGRSATSPAASDGSASETADASRSATSSTGTARPAPADFDRWLPDPATTTLPDGYGFRYFDVDGIRERRSQLHENAYERLRRQMLDPAPRIVDAADVEATLEIDFVMGAAFGSFDLDAVAAALRDDGDTSATAVDTGTPSTATRTPWPGPERYGGFDLHGRDRVYAVSPDAVLAVAPLTEGDALDYAKAIIDATDSGADRYPDRNEYVASLLDLVDSPDALRCFPEAMDGSTSRGFRADDITGQLESWRFTPEAAHLTFANTYADAETAESGEFRRFLEGASERFAPYDGLDVSVDGRLAWTEGAAPISEFDHLSPGGPGDGVTTAH